MVDQPPADSTETAGQIPRVGRSSFLRRHLTIILLSAVAVTAGALAYDLSKSSNYTAHARVLIQPLVLPGDVVRTPDMGTQKAVATSQVVLSDAAKALHLPVSTIDSATTVVVPVDADLLVFGYSASDAQAARDGATAVANAYVAHTNGRTPAPARVRTDVPGVPGLQATVISSAGVPSAPSSPNLVLNVLAGAAVGLLLGLLAAFATDRAGTRIRSVARWQDVTGVPVLLARRRGWRPDPLDGVASLDGLAPDAGIDHARIRISRTMPETAGVLLVTSCRDHPLGAVVPRQLAVAFAWAGRRTVLVEPAESADPAARRDSLPSLPSVPSVPSAANAKATPRTRTRPGPVRIVASWAMTDLGCQAYAEPETTAQLRTLITDLASVADVVVFAAPPMNRGLLALDVAAVASVAVLSDDAATARRGASLAAITELGDEGCPVRGGVLTGLERWRRTATSSATARTTPAPARERPTTQELGAGRSLPRQDGLTTETPQSVNHVRVPTSAANGRD